MPSITIKNIPEKTYNALKEVANIHHRSINGEIIHLIEQATKSKKLTLEEQLKFAKHSREKTKSFLLTEEILREIKEDGRP